jgi:hypothetical protein
MKFSIFIPVIVAACAVSQAPAATPPNILTGTWCVGREGLVISFGGKDSIRVTSSSDESIDGRGTYTKKGETLTATLTNEDLTLRMGYRYQIKPDSSIRARILFFTVNGDSVNHPVRWLQMKRCDPSKGIFPVFDDDDDGNIDK